MIRDDKGRDYEPLRGGGVERLVRKNPNWERRSDTRQSMYLRIAMERASREDHGDELAAAMLADSPAHLRGKPHSCACDSVKKVCACTALREDEDSMTRFDIEDPEEAYKRACKKRSEAWREGSAYPIHQDSNTEPDAAYRAMVQRRSGRQDSNISPEQAYAEMCKARANRWRR